MQDDIEKLDKEIADRHAAELAALEERLAADASDEGTLKLAESLYETKLSNDQDKVRAPFPTARKALQSPLNSIVSPQRHGLIAAACHKFERDSGDTQCWRPCAQVQSLGAASMVKCWVLG